MVLGQYFKIEQQLIYSVVFVIGNGPRADFSFLSAFLNL